MSIELYVGSHAAKVQGEYALVYGKRMFTAAHRPPSLPGYDTDRVEGLLDSGAFSDDLDHRLSFGQALSRQLKWEATASRVWAKPFRAAGLVSYDLLIDETWVQGNREKKRWTLERGKWAVEQTVRAAHFLAARRNELAPRRLVFSCQGVDAIQYSECVEAVLEVARPGDWLALGGWCILGRSPSLKPEFWATARLILPKIAGSGSGVSHLHILGVMELDILGGLCHLADQYGLTLSADSSRVVRDCVSTDPVALKRTGARAVYWQDNIEWWRSTLANIRHSEHYKPPPARRGMRQLQMNLAW